MMPNKISEIFVQNLLFVMPIWHSKLVKPFKGMLSREMSLETYYCLETLRAYGTATMTELAQQLKVPKQQATKLIDTLSSHQLVERVYHEADRRVIQIRLTTRAVSYLDGYYRRNVGFLNVLEERLTEDELLRLNHVMEELRDLLPKLG